MTGDDAILNALATLQLARELGSTDPLAEYLTLLGPTCEHQVQTLFLTGLLLSVADETGFDLDQLIAQERAETLVVEGPAGMA